MAIRFPSMESFAALRARMRFENGADRCSVLAFDVARLASQIETLGDYLDPRERGGFGDRRSRSRLLPIPRQALAA